MRTLTPIIAIFLLAACQKETLSPPTARVDTSAHLNGREAFPVAFITYDSCTEENVVITAVLEYKYNIVQNGDNLHAIACYNYKDARGVGASGAEYKLKGQTFGVERIIDADDANVYNVRIRSRLTFQTKGPDWVVEGTYRLLSEGGEIKTLIEEEVSFCK